MHNYRFWAHYTDLTGTPVRHLLFATEKTEALREAEEYCAEIRDNYSRALGELMNEFPTAYVCLKITDESLGGATVWERKRTLTVGRWV